MFEPYISPDAVGSVVSLVIAAQPGLGFDGGLPRWLRRWSDTSLLQHVVRQAALWPVTPGVVVLGSDAEEILDAIDFGDFTVLIDPEWAEGEAASLRVGLDYAQRQVDVDAVLLVAADTVQAGADVIDELLSCRGRERHPAIVPKYRYAPGGPLLLDRELWPRLLGLEGATTVEAVLATHAQWVAEVWLDQIPPRAVTTPQDLRELAPGR